MVRLSRISPAGVPVHIIQRRNNRQVCFISDEDRAVNRIRDELIKPGTQTASFLHPTE
jgi:REP element-mobilizing transposase RayT